MERCNRVHGGKLRPLARGRTLAVHQATQSVVQSLEPRQMLAADVVISEIMHYPVDPANPALVARGQEYIELYNRGAATVSLANWRITRGVDFTFPATNLPAGQYLVIASDPAQFQAKYPGVTNVIGGWIGRLSNSRETIEIKDANGVVIDSVSYADQGDWADRVRGPLDVGHYGWNWDQPADGTGKSLELVNLALTNNEGQNWRSSNVVHGTPGTANSVASANIAPMILNLEQTPVIPTSSQAVTVSVKLVDETAVGGLSATLHWRVDAATPPAFQSVAMHDDGLNGDVLAGDGTFTATIPAQANNAVVEFYVSATDGVNSRTWPAPTNDAVPQSANLLYQVDNAGYGGGTPLMKMIMTEKERLELRAISYDGDGTADGNSDAQMNATFLIVDGTGVKRVWNAGVRNRGKGSRNDQPPNYHVNIPTDRAINDITSYNINGRYSALEVMGSVIHQLAGVPAQAAYGATVRVNNLDPIVSSPGANSAMMFGHYAVLEALNTEWPDNHFPLDASGNFYRGYSRLSYLGTNKDSYRNVGTDSGYEKKTNTEDDDWQDLINLTFALDPTTTPDASYVAAVNAVADVTEWMRYFALSELIGNRENSLPNGDGDDYSFYRGLTDTRFKLIVHDLDTILGLGDTPGGETDPIFRAGNNPVSGKSNPIIERFLKYPDFAPIYYQQLVELATTVLAPANIDPVIDNVLGGYVPGTTRQAMKTFLVNRIAHVMTLIPQSLTASSSLTVTNGYPRTTTATTSLTGKANALKTRTVKVNGVAATYTPATGSWTLGTVALRAGINRVIVQAFDGTGAEIERTHIDIWRDTGTTTNVSGTLPAGTTTWTAANSPYKVTGNITVNAGSTLKIDPGVTVFFDAGFSVTFTDTGTGAQGKLDAQGTDYQRIYFTKTPTAASNWGGFRFNYATTVATASRSANKLTYAAIEYDDAGGESILMTKGRIDIDNVRWGNHTNQYIDVEDSSLILDNSFLPGISSNELIHFWGFPSDGYAQFNGNTFGKTSGYNDIIDLTGGQRPGPIAYFTNNTFLGGGDDGLDLDSTDAHIEGNTFMAFHQDGTRESKSHAVSTGEEGGIPSQITVVRNTFYDSDHGIIIKDGSHGTIINNTFVKIYKTHSDGTTGAINLYEPRSGQFQAAGLVVEGNVFQDISQLFEMIQPFPSGHPELVPIVFNRNIVPVGTTFPAAGVTILSNVGNLYGDPQLNNTTNVTNPWVDFALRPGPGPAVGSGPNGRDMGAVVPFGPSIAGEPIGTTALTSATLTIGGPDWHAYKFKVNDGAWSSEIANTDPNGMNPSLPAIQLNGLANGTYTVYVIGKDSAGRWMSEGQATVSRTWTVDSALAPRIRINEVLASNQTAYNNAGTFPDAIELYNYGQSDFDLSGMAITDTAGTRKYTFPVGTIVPAGQFKVLHADNSNAAPGPHLGFSLKVDGEGVYLYDTVANGGGLIDGVTFGYQLEDYSIARDAAGTWRLATPTLGAANAPLAMGDPHQLKINEWQADGMAPFADDFVEIYNPNDYPVDLGGLYITDKPDGDPTRHQVAALSFVKAKGYFVFTADHDPNQGADHTNFKLASDYGLIALFDSAGAQIDRVHYVPQSTGVSQGRSPDASGSYAFFATPNPGVTNPAIITQTVTTTLMDYTNSWRYYQSGAPANQSTLTWKDTAYSDAAWPSGGGLLYVESSALTAPKTTPLTIGRPTYYFRSVFNLPYSPGELTDFSFNLYLDDGAVIYINGQEAMRIRMDATATITDSTYALSPSVDNAALEVWTLPTNKYNLLHQGINTIAVEVHQQSSGSTDVVWGANITASRLQGIGTPVSTVPMDYTDSWRYYQTGAPANQSALTWKDKTYSDAAWPSGGGLLYVESSALTAPKTTPLNIGRPTYYFRSTFNLPYSPGELTDFAFNLYLDDGAVIYINGQEAMRIRMDPTATITDSTWALSPSVGDAALEVWTLPANKYNLLQEGENSIAVEVHQIDAVSTDIVWGASITATRLEATGTPGSALRITEVNYNPPGGGGIALTPNDYEFIEIKNTGATAVNLNGLRFSSGVAFVFPNTSLAAGAYGVIVKNPAAFAARYGTGINILGTFADSLDNDGELLQIVDANGAVLTSLAYSDSWQVGTDGGGYTLTAINESADAASFSALSNWTASHFVLGSPGVVDPTTPLDTIVINEVLANSDFGGDWIEIKNRSGAPVDISGWYLSDDAGNSFKYRFPAGSLIGSGEFLVIEQFTSFGNAGVAQEPFALSQAGQSLYLSASITPNVLTGYRQMATFAASDSNVTQGRHSNSDGSVDFVAMSSPTYWAENAAPLIGPVVINEVMYHPAGILPEYIELRNLTDQIVKLYDPANPANVWRFTDGIDFDFPVGAAIAPYGIVLISPIAPADFRSAYGLAASIPVFGPYTQNLSNTGDTITLAKPAPPDLIDGSVAYIPVDHVAYGTSAPWVSAPDGTGPSLSRMNTVTYGNDPASWNASAANGTPSQPNGAHAAPTINSLVYSGTVALGTPFLASGSFSDVDAGESWAAAVNFDEGAGLEPLTLNGDKTFAFGTTFSRPGAHNVTITITDSSGASASQTIVVQSVITPIAGDSYSLSLDGTGTILQVFGNGAVTPTYLVPVGATTPLRFQGGSATLAEVGDISAANLALTLDGTQIGAASDLRVGSIELLNGGRLDLADRSLIVDGGSLAAITALLASGRNGGNWMGPGIGTSHSGAYTGLAVRLNDNGLGQPIYTQFAGQNVGLGAVLVKYTYEGDANLDGRIDVDDYFLIDVGYALGRTGYASGDFNYSGGAATADDYFTIDLSYLSQSGPLSAGSPGSPFADERLRNADIEEVLK